MVHIISIICATFTAMVTLMLINAYNANSAAAQDKKLYIPVEDETNPENKES